MSEQTKTGSCASCAALQQRIIALEQERNSAIQQFQAAERDAQDMLVAKDAASQELRLVLKNAMTLFDAKVKAERALAALQQQIAGLVEQGYVQHKDECGKDSSKGWPPIRVSGCTCGLADLLARLGAGQKEDT